MEALQDLIATVGDLVLHNRLAIICPDRDFVEGLQSLLAKRLKKRHPDRNFVLKSAKDASAVILNANWAKEKTASEWIVLDEISQMDGLVSCLLLSPARVYPSMITMVDLQ